MRQKLKYQDVQDYCLWFLSPRRAHSELCNQSGGEKHGQKGKRDWCFNKCLIPKGHLHQNMRQVKSPGLSEVIAAEATLKEAIHKVKDYFYFLSCGERPPNPSELLETEDFHALLDEVNQKFDLVIVDTHPILAVADASVIAHYGGKVFMLLRSGQHDINEIRSAISKFDKSGTKVTGLILNDHELQSTGYGYSYQYSYK